MALRVVAIVLFWSATAVAGSPLSDALLSVPFLNSGVVHRGDEFCE